MPKVIPTWVWLVAIMVAFSAGALTGYKLGTGSRDSAALDAAVDQNEKQAEQAGESAQAGQQARAASAATTIATQDQTHAAQDRVRTVYVTVPAPADCSPAPGVRVEIDAAHERARRAVRAASGADPAAVSDRR